MTYKNTQGCQVYKINGEESTYKGVLAQVTTSTQHNTKKKEE
jgi:hypothetical protein